MDNENIEKKPYEPPTLTVVDLKSKADLLCYSGCDDPIDEMDGDFN